jgi:vacuolar-type H+-ATPase subunit I/STV1
LEEVPGLGPRTVTLGQLSSPLVKFLAWQFILYAIAAFNLGAYCVHLWWQPRHEAARRSADARRKQNDILQKSLTEEQAARAREKALVAQVPQLTQDLALSQQSVHLLEVEMEALLVRRNQAQALVSDLQGRARDGDSATERVRRLEAEVSRLRSELNDALATGAVDRADHEQAVARVQAALRNADEARRSLQQRHNDHVLATQKEISLLTLRAELAERANNKYAYQQRNVEDGGTVTPVGFTSTGDVTRVIDLRTTDSGEGDRAGRRSIGESHQETSVDMAGQELDSARTQPSATSLLSLRNEGAIVEPDTKVIDLRSIGE